MSLGSDYLRSLLEEDPERGVYRCKREMFTDPRLFELEMKHIFEGNWVYLAHESQVAGINDYLTTQIGRQSIVIARNRDGQLNAFINACSHRGAMLCRHKSGNRSSYTCPFHGWTFNNSGKLLKVKDPAEAGYPQGFNCEGSHDLTRVARFESYRGFLFGSLNPDVRPLAEHLGESAKIIDMIVDQSPEGLEVLRGSSSYVYEGNWKLTAENGADGYHVSSVHWNYAATQSQRQQRDAADQLRTMSAAGWARQGGGFYSFEHGHMLLWSRWANPEDRPAFERRAELARDFGEARADWMIENSRNLCLYPNVYLMDQFSSQIRIARPLSVDRTEITIYCIAPKGESAEARARRIRQYEDFFNVSGMATPDDLEEFRSCQQGYQGSVVGWNDLSRGAEHWIEGADAAAAAIDLRPRLSGVRTEDEGLFVLQHRYWQEALLAALERERTQRVEDPQREISLIWYGNRGGLEDRVFRIRTERSSATLPDTRTSHNLSNIELLGEDDGICRARCNWHTLSYRYKTVDSYFGTTFYDLDVRGESPLIKAKKVILKNDYVRQLIDVYHV
ncbi:benzoate 1,2-dioxygenase large subunit [Pseudomonas aeruginosa]|nr:benzoate 1,2-dioxygenase large subunit [Pseudomonas aeruginosa]NPY71002.1 benzoate 1,2-dioxygenase large subunit [Pseudomonas aeruginosa]